MGLRIIWKMDIIFNKTHHWLSRYAIPQAISITANLKMATVQIQTTRQ